MYSQRCVIISLVGSRTVGLLPIKSVNSQLLLFRAWLTYKRGVLHQILEIIVSIQFINIVFIFILRKNLIYEEVVLIYRDSSCIVAISVNIYWFYLYHIMPATNVSIVEVLLINQQIFQIALTEGHISKVTFAILMPLFFIYLNAIMIYTLRSKTVFKDAPRYILFTHMLFNDSIQLIVTSLLYILGLAYLRIVMSACAFLVFVSSTTFRNAPLNLALMSLERYVAICFPLRHAEIATQKRTYTAIGIIWFMGLMHFIIDLLFVVMTDPEFLNLQIFCKRERLFLKQWQADVYQGFNIFYFVSVSVIILFTYVRILITTRSISSNKDSATKAHKTVLLHFVQLGLCITSFLFSIIEQAAAMASTSISLFLDLRYINYMFVLILPRCLSPLIYGLRDKAIWPLFMYYFRCATVKHRSTVNVH